MWIDALDRFNFVSPKNYTIGSGTPGEITRKLASAYKKIVAGENKNYQEWLTYVNG